MNSKNNGPVLLVKTIILALKLFPVGYCNGWQEWIWIATRKKLAQRFQVLKLCLQKSTKNIMVSAP